MKILFSDNQKLAGAALCLLGTFVLTGWAAGSEAMVRVVPGSVAMGVNTATLFIAAGLCFIFSSDRRGKNTIQKICIALLVLLPGLILIEHVFDADLGIDFVNLHAAVNDGNPRPGRTPPNTCVAFMLAGLVFYLRNRAPAGKPTQQVIVVLSFAVTAIGCTALLGYILDLEMMYQVAAFNRMAVPTAVGISVLGICLTLLDRNTITRIASEFRNEEKQITRLAAVVLTVLAIIAGLSGFSIFRQGFEKSEAQSIQNRTKSNAVIISNMLDQAQLLAKSVALRPALQERLRKLSVNPRDADTLALVETVGKSLLQYEFSGVRFFNGQGNLLVSSGSMDGEKAATAVSLAAPNGNAVLFWQDGFLFRSENIAVLDGQVVGKIITEQRLDSLTNLVTGIQRDGESNDMVLCGRSDVAAICFPSRFYAANTRIPMFKADSGANLPISRALLGYSGAFSGNDARGVAVFAGYAPLTKYGLGLVQKTDAREVYAPLRGKLNVLIGLVIIFVLSGTLFLRKLVQPLVDRLIGEQRRMKVILENSNDAFVALSHDGLVTDWNAQAERTLGWRFEEAIGKNLANLIIPPAQRDAHNAGFRRFMSTGTGPVINHRIEVHALHRSGKEIPVELSIASFHDGKGYIASAFLRDITDRKEEERRAAAQSRALEESRVALMQSQKLEAVGKLTGGIAHDFNNVLQIIGGSLQLLQGDIVGKPGSVKRVETALGAVARGAKLSTQLLAFARKQPLQPFVINLGQVVRGMDDLLQRALDEEIKVETAVGGGLWNTFVDPNQLEHVILNLAINARDAMRGSGKLTIEIGNAILDEEYIRSEPGLTAGQYVVLAMSDTGAGMSADIKERVFEPFFTTKAEGEGTGLGLSMAYGFIKQSEGHIRIYSEIGQGTTVRIYLPRSFGLVAALPAAPSGPIVGGSETILVVEDDLAVQATVVEMLTSLGYRVFKADNGDSALKILESGVSVDLLFTDVVMPGLVRSPELAKQAKMIIPGIQILFTSGYTQNAIVHGGRLDPGVSLLSKPYRREQLAHRIRQLLSERKMDVSHRIPEILSSDGRADPAASASVRILVVEDNVDFRFLVCETLAMLGHDPHGFTTAEEALEPLASGAFDILLSDVRLPGMSGVELAKIAVQKVPGIKIIFSSGQADLERKLAFSFTFLKKPYDLAKLKHTVEQAARRGY